MFTLGMEEPSLSSVLVAGGSSCALSCALEAQEGTGLLVCSAVGSGMADEVGHIFSPSGATGRCMRARCVRTGKGVG